MYVLISTTFEVIEDSELVFLHVFLCIEKTTFNTYKKGEDVTLLEFSSITFCAESERLSN